VSAVLHPGAREAAAGEVVLGAEQGDPGTDIGRDVSPLLGCLVIAARYRGVHLSVPQLIHDHVLSPGEPSVPRFLEIVRASGLRAAEVKLAFADLLKLGDALPAILLLRNGGAMVMLAKEARDRTLCVILQDPFAGGDAPLVVDEERLAHAWSGRAILIKRDYRLLDEAQPFSMRMIMGLVLRDRAIARDVAISALLLGLFALSPIIFWRLLIDRVIYYQSLSTLSVLCLAMVVLVAFDTMFGYLRRYLVSFVAKRVDAKLSTDMFLKMLNLPIEFFESRPTGVIMRDMNEVWKIRTFLSGQLFGTVLDASVVLVILPFMFAFNAVLTCIVLFFCLLICGWLLLMLPVIRRKSALVFKAEGDKSSFQVESLHGIRTIKSLALEARRRRDWDVHVTRTAELRFDESRTANVIQTVVHPLERLMTSGVFALAVYLAITTHDQVEIGALIAFMMLTMRMAAPLTQLASLLPDFDEARLAVDVIAKMVNQPPEEGHGGAGLRTPIVGPIEFRDVTFRYRGTSSPALDRVSFVAEAGSILGIMGRSGSGKTTVTRLLQMLHSSYEGAIKIAGTDIRTLDIDHLRAGIGVVMQENFLFRGTLRDTVAPAKADATLADVMQACRLAGADEFIERLPRGYDTWIEEGSTNLSGGQRQRLAIARALITDPRILILDEATSALDAESEAIVNANLLSIAKGRTMIIVSHRLSSLVAADAILVLDQGRVEDLGRHDELLKRCEIYGSLWFQQHRHLEMRPGA
jgi:ATP-binding cassette subfamily B protein